MGSPTIFKGKGTLFLTDNLEYRDGSNTLKNDSDDPNTTAKNALAGSEYHQSGTNKVYKKLVDGNNTKWKDTDASPDLIYHLNADWADIDQFSTGNNATFDGGGTLGGTFSRSTTAADLINGVAVFKYVGDALASNNTNDYMALEPVNVPQGFRGNFVTFRGHYKWDGSNDVFFRVKDTTNGDILTGSSHALVGFTPLSNEAAPFSFLVFIPDDCQQIELGFQIGTGEASKTLLFDEIPIIARSFVEGDLINTQTIRVAQHNGVGSTDNKIRRFSTLISNKGDTSLITRASTAANGDTYTVNRACKITASLSDLGTSTVHMGLSLNSTQLTTGIEAITQADRLAIGRTQGNNVPDNITVEFDADAGDVIRCHIEVDQSPANPEKASFTISGTENVPHVIVPAKSNLTNWTSYTPTWTGFGTVTNNRARYRRVGDTLEVEANVNAGTPTATVALISIPSGLTIDTSKVTAQPQCMLGWWAITEAATQFTAAAKEGYLFYDSTLSTTNLIFSYQSTSDGVMQGATASSTWGVGDGAIARFSVPIVEWSAEASFLAAIPLQQTAYIDVDASKYTDNFTATTAYKTIPLVQTSGDDHILTIGSDQLTLPKGKYEIQATGLGIFGGGSILDFLIYNITDAANFEEFLNVAFSTVSAVSHNTVVTTIDISETKTFEFRTKSSVASGLEFHGRIAVTKIR